MRSAIAALMATEALFGGKVLVPPDEDTGEMRVFWRYSGGCCSTNDACKKKSRPRLSPKLWSMVGPDDVIEKLVNHLVESPGHAMPDADDARHQVMEHLDSGAAHIQEEFEDWDMRQTHRDWAAKWAKTKEEAVAQTKTSCKRKAQPTEGQLLRSCADEFDREWNAVSAGETRRMTSMFQSMMESIHASEHGTDAEEIGWKVGSILSLTNGDVFGCDFQILDTQAAKKARMNISKAASGLSGGSALQAKDVYVQVTVDNLKTLANVMVRTKREVRAVKAEAEIMEATAVQLSASAKSMKMKMKAAEQLVADCQVDLARILADSFKA